MFASSCIRNFENWFFSSPDGFEQWRPVKLSLFSTYLEMPLVFKRLKMNVRFWLLMVIVVWFLSGNRHPTCFLLIQVLETSASSLCCAFQSQQKYLDRFDSRFVCVLLKPRETTLLCSDAGDNKIWLWAHSGWRNEVHFRATKVSWRSTAEDFRQQLEESIYAFRIRTGWWGSWLIAVEVVPAWQQWFEVSLEI